MRDPEQHPDPAPELSDEELEDVSGGRRSVPPPEPTPIVIDPPLVYPSPTDIDLEP